MYTDFLPISKQEALEKGLTQIDFVVVTGDAYVDHPSFGAAIISRLVQSLGFSVAILSQPNFNNCESFKEYGKPKYAFLIGGGNVDSMVAHYTVAKKRRTVDEYTPGGVVGKRPDRSAMVYSQLAKQAYPDTPVVLGGLEASLRRFAHYDYWQDTVLPSIIETSKADLISFGMSETQTIEICTRLANGEDVSNIIDVKGTCYYTNDVKKLPKNYIECAGFSKVSTDKLAYAKAVKVQMDNQDVVTSAPVVQKQNQGYLVQNIPATPLNPSQLDKIYDLPFTRHYHPSYEKKGGVPAIEEVEFSIIQNRGCFGGCNFCAITMHQGRRVTSRTKQSILQEAENITNQPNFKGYIHDVGGPTANFRKVSCAKQMQEGMCNNKKCLAPSPCSKLIVDHTQYLDILKAIRKLPKVKKVFVRSGIRYDYLILDKNEEFFKQLIKHHISGQLKVAPEHCASETLKYMGKPGIHTYDKFSKRFYELTKKEGKKQYLVPYLMSSHPGSTLKDAVILAEYLYTNKIKPEQVQDFYPTPGTISTCMFYTGLDPQTLKPVYVAKTNEEKAMQRALLQYYLPKNKAIVLKALKKVNRMDLANKLVPNFNIQKKDKGDLLWKPVQKSQSKKTKNDKKRTSLSKHITKRKAK